MALALAAGLRIYLQFLAALAIKYLPFKASFPYWESVLAEQGPNWLWLWGNFDGVHYLNIVKVGYQYGLTQAFFPLYPNLIKLVNFLVHNSLISGLVISHLCLVGFIYFFLKLGRLDYPQKTVNWAVVLLLLFPTSFFFFGVYTESLFLFLAAGAFFLARQKKFLFAFALAGLASATRLIGIFLLPAILWEYYQAVKKPNWLSVGGYSFLGAAGLLGYLAYLQYHFHNFLIFVEAQPGFGAGRQIDKVIMLYQVIVRYFKMLLTVSAQNEIYPVLAFEFLISLVFIGLIVWALLKKFRASYLIFVIPALLLPTLSGSFSSMPRYVLSAFPLFYFFASRTNRWLKWLLIPVFIILLSWAFIRFSRGYWLA